MFVDCLYFRVVGVTFENDDGSSRQKYISKLHEGDPLGMESFDYEGSVAFHILDENDHCIGNLPKDHVQFILDHYNAGHRIELSAFEILGRDENGHRIDGFNLGVEVSLTVYDDSIPDPESASDPLPGSPVRELSEIPNKKPKSGRIMIAFGIICAVNAVVILNPMTAVLSAVLLFFGIRRYKTFKNTK